MGRRTSAYRRTPKRARRAPGDDHILDHDFMNIGGRLVFVAGYPDGGAPYGSFVDDDGYDVDMEDVTDLVRGDEWDDDFWYDEDVENQGAVQPIGRAVLGHVWTADPRPVAL